MGKLYTVTKQGDMMCYVVVDVVAGKPVRATGRCERPLQSPREGSTGTASGLGLRMQPLFVPPPRGFPRPADGCEL